MKQIAPLPSNYIAFVRRESAHDWRVYTRRIGMNHVEQHSMHTTHNGALSTARRLNATR